MANRILTIIPSVPVWVDGEYYVFDRKFYDGVILYKKLWPGPVRCVMRVSDEPLPSFGVIKKLIGELSFGLLPLKSMGALRGEDVSGSAVVMAAGDSYDQLHISELCVGAGVKCVYVIEYIPETRYQIVAFETRSFILRLRRWFFVWSTERKRLKAFSFCDGIQANGRPAFLQYGKYSDVIEYFDTRVEKKQLVTELELERRFNYLLAGRPIRLAFSGRLIRMKGVDQLIVVARRLKQWGVPFSLSIYGAGDLEFEVKAAIYESGLSDCVILNGAVDFFAKLLPDMKSNVDIFVCLHRQSDPSCTYMETLACGVPILGYDNKAFSGIMDIAKVGWLVKMDDSEGVAGIIRKLSEDRRDIVDKSRAAIVLARENYFGSVFDKRVAHLKFVAGE